ncbi:MAG TPA: GAF domain-containing protein, partial [Thermomicrobiales bacterium]
MTSQVANPSDDETIPPRALQFLTTAAAFFSSALDCDAMKRRAVEHVATALDAAAFFLSAAAGEPTAQASAFATDTLRAAFQPGTAAMRSAFTRAHRADTARIAGEHGDDIHWLSVPIRRHTARYGTLVAARRGPGFAAADLALAEQFGLLLAAALEHATQAEAAGRDRRAIELLSAVDTLLHGGIGDADTLVGTLSALVTLLGTTLGESSALFLIERGQATLLLLDLYHADAGEQERQRAAIYAAPPRLGEGIIGTIALSESGRIIDPTADAGS